MNSLSRNLRGSVAACIIVLLWTSLSIADGVMRPSNTSYPSDFLRHKITKIDVAFHGQVAVTTVYQEFQNEWTQKVDAVYSFPLARDARATDFLFWSNDSVFRAPLKIREQAINPGTGEGGVDALLTQYLGSNALRVLIHDVPAGKIQRIQMEFISLCRYDKGKLLYTYPLATSQFTDYPVDGLYVTFTADNVDEIKDVQVQGWGGATIHQTDARHVSASFDQSKVFLTSDLTFSMTTAPDTLSVDMQSTNVDTLGGHFVLFVKPQGVIDTAKVLPKNVVFLFDQTINTSVANLQAAVQAAKLGFGLLRTGDRFNIRSFNYSGEAWRTSLVSVTSSAVDSARAYLDGISTLVTGISSLETAITTSFSDFPADSSNCILFVFSDGRTAVDPKHIATANTKNVAVYPVGMGSYVRWHLLELLAYMNGGTPTVIPTTDEVADQMAWLFDQVNNPILRGVRMEMGPNATDVYPQLPQSLYSGSRFYLAGRFKNPGVTSLAIAGIGADGPRYYGYVVNFPEVTNQHSYVAKLWAKERLDALERQIDVYGATDSLKSLAISISLKYGIRCMYTAYIADKSIPVSGVVEGEALLASTDVVQSAEGIFLRWTFKDGMPASGVYVYRSTTRDGQYSRLNETPVIGMSFIDRSAPRGDVWYKLEIVSADGKKVMSPPIAGRSNAPSHHALLQNYPNPFNPSTNITFAVASTREAVSLAVYDMLGREIRALASGYWPIGVHQVVWDGTDSRGKCVAAGVYYYRMRIGPFLQTRSMLLVH